jgi:putative peptidoglycan lipid II flippase
MIQAFEYASVARGLAVSTPARVTGVRQEGLDRPAGRPPFGATLLQRAAEPLQLAALATLNLIVTFAFQWLPVTVLGVGAETDALFVSAIIPQVLAAVASSGLTSVLTPELAMAGDTFRARAWTYLHGVALVGVATIALVYSSAELWTPWLAPGFDGPTRTLALSLIQVQLLGAFATMLLMVAWAAQYASQGFRWVEGSGVVAGLAALALGWWGSDRFGVVAWAWAMTLRSVLQLALCLPVFGAYRRPNWRAAETSSVLRRLGPPTAGAVYFKLDPMVDRVLASFAPAGQLSLLHLAQLAFAAGNQVLTRALINPVMPGLAALARTRRPLEFTRLLHRRLRLVIGLALGSWLLLAVSGGPLLRLLLSRWLTIPEVDLLYVLLLSLLGVWLGGATGQLLTTAFFAVGDTRTPTQVGVVGFTVAIPLKFGSYRFGGIEGLAIASSVYTIGTAVGHLVFLERAMRRHWASASDSR